MDESPESKDDAENQPLPLLTERFPKEHTERRPICLTALWQSRQRRLQEESKNSLKEAPERQPENLLTEPAEVESQKRQQLCFTMLPEIPEKQERREALKEKWQDITINVRFLKFDDIDETDDGSYYIAADYYTKTKRFDWSFSVGPDHRYYPIVRWAHKNPEKFETMFPNSFMPELCDVFSRLDEDELSWDALIEGVDNYYMKS